MRSQLSKQTGMGRPGAAASKGSTPVRTSVGKAFASMEAAMLTTDRPNPKALAPKDSPHFRTQAAGYNSRSQGPKAYSAEPGPAIKALEALRNPANKVFSNRSMASDNKAITRGELPVSYRRGF
jgi:hypothetical protein